MKFCRKIIKNKKKNQKMKLITEKVLNVKEMRDVLGTTAGHKLASFLSILQLNTNYTDN